MAEGCEGTCNGKGGADVGRGEDGREGAGDAVADDSGVKGDSDLETSNSESGSEQRKEMYANSTKTHARFLSPWRSLPSPPEGTP